MEIPSARSTIAFLAARWASIETCCHWQPPQLPNSGHGGGTRSALARSIAVSSPQAARPFSRSIRTRTRSPGAASGTKVARPSLALSAPAGLRCRPMASPPMASPSISTVTSRRSRSSIRLREGLPGAAAGEVEVEEAVERAANDRGGRRGGAGIRPR